jgi:xanthine dehydrogenase YagS FAD-binding subunit
MNPFTYSRAADERQAIVDLAARPGAKFLGGGTNLIDLMKMGVETPVQLIDINHLPMEKIEELPTGGVRIGALVRNSDLAEHPTIKARYPVLSEALLAGAFGIWPRSAAISCSARDALTFMTRPFPSATSARRAVVAAR